MACAEARRVGPIDVLVNNAGFEVASPVDSLSDEMLHHQFDTNVYGVVRMICAVAPEMRERRKGAIINLSSVLGWLTQVYTAAYAASKHAVESLSEGLWFELAPFGIRIAIVEPGVFPARFGANTVASADFQEGSPHRANFQRYNAALRSTMAAASTSANPQDVANAEFEAATTATPVLRYVVGADARAFIPAYKSMQFEAFRDAVLSRAGITDWAALS